MTDPTTDRRIEALEIKASFTEDLVDQLDQIVTRQQHTIDALVAELRLLREQVTRGGEAAGPRLLRDELPPHY